MNSNVLALNEQMVETTMGVYGSDKIRYNLFVMGLCGTMRPYEVGTLNEKSVKQVNYKVSEQFPDDEFGAVLKATATEIAQVHGVPVEFVYNKLATAVEFIKSEMQGIDTTGIHAGILKNFLKKYDFESWYGRHGNTGIENNNNANIETGVVWDGTFEAFKVESDAALTRLKNSTDLTSDDYDRVNMSYTESIANMLTEVDTFNISNREKLQKAYPSIVMREIPDNIVANDESELWMTARDFLTFHHGSLPSIYSEEKGRHGLSTNTLYAYESMAVECEENGAIQGVKFTAAA